MKVKKSIARYAKLELDPVRRSTCQDYSHWQSRRNWFLSRQIFSVRIMFLFTNNASRWRSEMVKILLPVFQVL